MDLIEQVDLDDITYAVKKFNVQLSPDKDDPQKGRWGMEAKKNFRKISAVVQGSKVPGLYNVIIKVVSTKKDIPLIGEVKFHLHDTFLNPTPVIAVKDGRAILTLTGVWGAFTVGAETDDGKTHLELDLSQLPKAPKQFKEK
jgi:hypothetical protein